MIVLQKYSEVFDFQSKNIKNINLILLSTLISGTESGLSGEPTTDGLVADQDAMTAPIWTFLLPYTALATASARMA